MYFGFKDISISYGIKQVLNDVTIEIPKGKIVTIIGQNGCGKSSLLRILTKGVKQQKGSVIIEGKDISTYKPKKLAQRMAVLPQIHQLPPDITVETLVSYGRFPHLKFGQTITQQDKRIIDDSIEKTSIAHLRNSRVTDLSGGERQRCWIAMLICQQPEILVLDEPTTFLDICHQIEILELVKQLNLTMGLTTVMVLHDLNLAARYSDLLYVIKNSKVYTYGTPKQVLTSHMIRNVFHINSEICENCHSDCPHFIPTSLCKQKASMPV